MDPEHDHDPGQGVQPSLGLDESARAEPEHQPRSGGGEISRELGGDLPCVICGYNLRGLSIRGVCPECGAGVRATILAVVDPHASVLQPIRRPRMVAGALLLWTGGGLGAALVCWAPHFADALSRVAGRLTLPPSDMVLTVLLALAMVGAAGLVRPHAGIARPFTAAAIAAVLLHVPLGWALIRLHIGAWPATARGTVWVLMAMGCLAAIFLLLRPTLRLLVARSLLLRSGRVDRQTLYGMAAAAGVIAAGQLSLHWSISGSPEGIVAARVLGVALLVTGGALLTLGLFGSVVDAVRIARAIIRPLPSLGEVLRSGASRHG